MSANPLVGTALLGVHAASVWFCTGLVWTIQLLVYPGFAAMTGPGWLDVHARHTRLMGRLIGLPWLVQGLTCAVLLVWRPPGVPLVLALAAGVCGAVTVAVTLAISVPCHTRLSHGWDADVHARLTRTNWWRTAAWTLGGAVALAMLLVAA
ncbi:hypothetical protein [Actinomycetospora straminea]|uniref:DUF1772 domain-containing protein n=1 Tax=Actinomycetospora straminea TaxID=663607 RepID=A0ABP9E3D5_9PSEU|nr:hypothetical protein [Actinomycetospora straminea]MDD7934236.1 hypothetical protein [Actinomycetospora straminea]